MTLTGMCDMFTDPKMLKGWITEVNTHRCERGPDRLLFTESYVYWFLEEKQKTPVL